jgi:hypothetical protein
MMINARFTCVAFILFSVFCVTGHSYTSAAQQSMGAIQPAATEAQNTEMCKSDPVCMEMKRTLDKIQMKIELTEQWVPFLLTVFAIGLGIIPIYLQRKSEVREDKLQRRSEIREERLQRRLTGREDAMQRTAEVRENKMMALMQNVDARAVQAEARAAEVHSQLLGATKETITLVNQTLNIAKEESEHAANALHNSATVELNDLDLDIKKFLANVNTTDVASVTTTPIYRARIKKFSDRTNKIDNYNLLLDRNKKISLTCNCKFIDGIQQHIEQNFDEALELWGNVAVDAHTPPLQKGIAWYWMGHLNNNLGEFPDAEKNFHNGSVTGDPEHLIEYKRSEIESRFFAYTKYKADTNGSSIISALSGLREDVEKAMAAGDIAAHVQLRRVMLLQGNVHYAFGVEGGDNSYIEKARKIYKDLAEISASTNQTYAQLGYAQASLALGIDIAEVKQLLSKIVQPAAYNEALERVEPRSRATRLAIELLCCLASDNPENIVRARYIRDDVTRALAGLDSRLTVFSPVVKRNLKKEDFLTELRNLIS